MALLNHEGMVKWYILQFDYLSLAPVIVALAFLLNSRGFHLLLVQIIPTLKKKFPSGFLFQNSGRCFRYLPIVVIYGCQVSLLCHYLTSQFDKISDNIEAK